MYKGFYNAVSGILTQSRVLNTIGNNVTNASTPGFKKDVMVTSTFRDVYTARVGNTDKRNPAGLGDLSSIRTVQELATVFAQGGVNSTGRMLDFAIEGPGFFEIQTAEGTAYTRNGAFTLDEDGYLCLPGAGRVMGEGGPIWLGSDGFTAMGTGTLLFRNGAVAGTLRVVDFEEYAALDKNAAGLFTSTAQPAGTNAADTSVVWQALEGANVSVIEETTSMIEAQRAFQSASQFLRMYDQLNDKANEIGSIR